MTTTLNVEEVIKFQQDLMNQQRTQKAIQKETIRLMTNLNRNIMFMSSRLDQFAQRANIKLDDGSGGGNLASVLGNDVTGATSTTAMSTTSGGNGVSFDESMIFDEKDMAHLNDVITLSTNDAAALTNHQGAGGGPVYALATTTTPITNTTTTGLATTPKRSSSGSKLNKINTILAQQDASGGASYPTTATTNFIIATTTTSPLQQHHQQQQAKQQLQQQQQHYQQQQRKSLSPNKSLDNLQGKLDSASALKVKETEESANQQRLFNKYVRECIEKRLGDDFLLYHEIQEIDQNIMEEVKRDALSVYPPIHIRPRRAWHLAKASLRCRRRSLRRQKEKQVGVGSGSGIVSQQQPSTSSTALLHHQQHDNSAIANSLAGGNNNLASLSFGN